jgi:hypothetical protein
MPAKKPSENCPDCYLFDGVDQALQIRQGTTPRCDRGHTWPEMEDLDQRISLAKRKREAVNKQSNPPKEASKPETPPSQLPVDKPSSVVLSTQDQQRLAQILGGEFGDGATLFGLVFSLKDDLSSALQTISQMQAQKNAAAAQRAGAPAAPTKSGEDLILQVVIPERHVQPLQDISEANGADITTYVNSVVEGGLDSSWFYAIICAMGGLIWHIVSIANAIPIA